MKSLSKTLTAAVLSTVMVISAAPSAQAVQGPRVKNDLGMFTVRCHAHDNAPGNNVRGYIVGNHQNNPDAAERDAKRYLSKHGAHGKVTARHCQTKKKYQPSGAYTASMRPI